jgi:hypothetical protein
MEGREKGNWYNNLKLTADTFQTVYTKLFIMAKYSKGAGKKVEEAMHEMKEGKLTSGRSGKKVTSPKQAIAIGLSEARERGAKVPAKKSASKGGSKAAPKKSATKSASKSSGGSKGATKRGTKKAAPRKSASKAAAGRKGGLKTAAKKSASKSATSRSK